MGTELLDFQFLAQRDSIVPMAELKTAEETLEVISTMATEELLLIQSGIAEMMVARFTPEEIAEIRESLDQAEAAFERSEGIRIEDIRKEFGIE
jgi:DNA-binding FadR family transcriptional regulator